MPLSWGGTLGATVPPEPFRWETGKGDSWADEKVCRLSLRWHCQTQEMKNPARAKRSCGEKQETRWKGGRGHPAKGSSSRSVSPLASATIANRYTSTTTILVKKRAKGLKEGKRTVRRFMKRCPAPLIRETRIETTVSYHLTPIGTATI